MARCTRFRRSLIYSASVLLTFAICQEPGHGNPISASNQTGAENQTAPAPITGSVLTTPLPVVDNLTQSPALNETVTNFVDSNDTATNGLDPQSPTPLPDDAITPTAFVGPADASSQRPLTTLSPVTAPPCFRGGSVTETGECQCPTHFTQESKCFVIDDERLTACDDYTREVYPTGSQCDGITTCPTDKGDESSPLCVTSAVATLWELKKLTPSQQSQFCTPVSDQAVLETLLGSGNYNILLDTGAESSFSIPGNETHPCLYYYLGGEIVSDPLCPTRPTLCQTGTSLVEM